MGGECPYWGCIPSKMIVRAASALAEARRVPLLAGSAAVRPAFAPVARRIRDAATDGWDDAVAVARFEKAGGVFLRGAARIEGRGRVRVRGTGGPFAGPSIGTGGPHAGPSIDAVVRARRGVVVATGSEPVRPPIPGLAEAGYWTNREAVAAPSAPPSLVVLGDGAIGLELAQGFARFGTAMTVVEGGERLLPTEEPEAGAVVARALAGDGVRVLTGRRAVAVSRGAGGTALALDDGTTVSGAELLVAVGRRPAGRGLNLEVYGVAGPAVPTDARMRAADGLWAVGDVTGAPGFTHLAVHHARIAVADILGRALPGDPAAALPRVTFTDPEVGAVGLTEAAARAAGLAVAAGRAPVAASSRGCVHGPGGDGLVKLVVDIDRDLLVGATAAGPSGGEVLGLLALAVHARVPVRDLRSMILAYPTFHRGVQDALAALTAVR